MATLAAGATGSEAKPAAFFGWRVVAAAFTVLCVAYGIQCHLETSRARYAREATQPPKLRRKTAAQW